MQTVNPAVPSDRVFYPQGEISTTPVIRMAYVVAPGNIDNVTQLPVGFFRVNARYSVRGRRGEPLPLSTVFSRLTPHEKKLAMQWLQVNMGLSAPTDVGGSIRGGLESIPLPTQPRLQSLQNSYR